MSDWTLVLDHSTLYSALDAIADRFAVAAIDDLRDQLAAGDTLTAAQQIAMLQAAGPLIRRTARAEVETSWVACRLDVAGGTTH
jgi:hypothetical protein